MLNGIDEGNLNSITHNIWSSMLGLELSSAESSPIVGKKVSACVQILGKRDWAVRLDCSEELVRIAAAACIGIAPEELGMEQIRDTAGELANMTGGGLKILLPKPSTLSLPSVAHGRDFSMSIPHSKLVLESAYTYGSGTLIVSVFERLN